MKAVTKEHAECYRRWTGANLIDEARYTYGFLEQEVESQKMNGVKVVR